LRFLATLALCQNQQVNRVTPLVRTEAIALARFAHEPHVAHRDPDVEQAASHALSFVESGAFRVRVADTWHDVTPRHMFVTAPGMEFSCAHEGDYPDDCCLSVRYTDEAVESLRREGASVAGAPVTPLTNRRAYLRLQLADAAAGDEARAEAIAGALYWSMRGEGSEDGAGGGRPKPLFRAHQLSWYAARIARAKALMESDYAEPLSLSKLARDAGMSVYHFARVYHELEGQTPHRRLLHVRLAHARRRLREGAGVTDTCYSVGFGSLSHFVTTYRRHFGVRPSHGRPPR
jgi:AraC-like DNA-binding protein